MTAHDLSELIISHTRTPIVHTGLMRSHPSTTTGPFRSNLTLIRQAAQFSISPGQQNEGMALDFQLRERTTEEFTTLQAAITIASQRSRFQ